MGARPITRVELGEPIRRFEDSAGDKWYPVVTGADELIVVNGDGPGFHAGAPASGFSLARLTGDRPETLEPEPLVQVTAFDEIFPVEPDTAGWRVTGMTSVGGVLVAAVTGRLLPATPRADRRIVFFDAGLVGSTDGGRTWTPAPSAVRAAPMFPGQAFGSPYFVAGDDDPEFVYATSNDGHFDNGDRVVVGRVPRDRLTAFDAADWSFFAGDGTWERLDAAAPILSRPGSFGIAGVTRIPALGRYVLPAWRYANPGLDFTTVLEFFEAPHPWGPWTSVAEIPTGEDGWYAPVVVPRFQDPVDARTVRAVLFTSGTPTAREKLRLHAVPVTLSTD